MEAAEAGDAFSSVSGSVVPKDKGDKDEVRVRRKALQAVLEQCQRAIELLSHDDDLENESDGNHRNGASQEDENSRGSSSPDSDIDELCDMINHQVRGADFLKKIEDAQASIHIAPSEDGTPWEIVGKKDTWELENDGLEHEEYVLVKQEDIVDGIACFMSAYLLSLKQTKCCWLVKFIAIFDVQASLSLAASQMSYREKAEHFLRFDNCLLLSGLVA